MSSYTFDPVTFIALLLVLLVIFVYLKYDRRLFSVIVLLTSFFIVLSSPLFANFLTYCLEKAIPESECAFIHPDAIVVLGGGVKSSDSDVYDTGNLYVASYRRTQGALFLANNHLDLPVIITGGSGAAGQTESDLMAQLLIQQQIKPERIFREKHSQNTWQSGVNTAKLLHNRGINSIYLVTSALHMPRAKMVFEKQGLVICPYPVDKSLVIPGWLDYFNVQISALVKTSNAIYEISGITWYYVTGKI